MKKNFLALILLSFVYAPAFTQSSKNNIVLAITPFYKASDSVNVKYISMVSESMEAQASTIKELQFVSRSPQVLENISTENKLQRGPDWLNAKVLAEVHSQSGATYLLVGDVSAISLSRVPIKKTPFGTLYGKLVTVILSVKIINVSTGIVDLDKQITSNIQPTIMPLPDDRVISDKIKNDLGKQFRDFLKDWYNSKTGVSSIDKK